jgi:predicted phosphodiesterase
MKFQVLSDLHLKPNDNFKLNITAPFLILAGDIGYPFTSIFWQFIEYVNSKYVHIYFVPGNHEFYGHSIETVDNFLRNSLKRYKNITYMNGDCVVLDDIVLIGSILWSYVPKDCEKIARNFGPHKNISNFSVEKRNSAFKSTAAWIESKLDSFPDKKKILITHYAPLCHESCHPKHDKDIKNHDYGSDLHKFINVKKVHFFIYGHTHYNYEGNILKKHEGIYISNQRGSGNSDNFNTKFTIEC